MQLARFGHFQEHLVDFMTKFLAQKTPVNYNLKDGTVMQVVASFRKDFRGIKEEGVLIVYGDHSIFIQNVLGRRDREFKILTDFQGHPSSTLNYSVLTIDETAARDQALQNSYENMSKEEALWIFNKLAKSVPDVDNPKPVSFQSTMSAEEIPLVAFTSPLAEAQARISWPTLNTGGSPQGFRIIALLIDHIYAQGTNSRSINDMVIEFNQVYLDYIQDYIIRGNVLENIRYRVRGLSGNDAIFNDNYGARILSHSELGQRAIELAEESGYFDGFHAGQEAFSDVPPGQYFTLQMGHYFQIYDLEALKRGEIVAYTRNLQRSSDDQNYLFSFDEIGNSLNPFNENDYMAFVATQVFLQDLSEF